MIKPRSQRFSRRENGASNPGARSLSLLGAGGHLKREATAPKPKPVKGFPKTSSCESRLHVSSTSDETDRKVKPPKKNTTPKARNNSQHNRFRRTTRRQATTPTTLRKAPTTHEPETPAERWLVDGGPATVGVIGSVTRPF
ncbi:hypothetical protein ABTZ89_19980, partial [Saccharopolyspora sp. NPDC002686]